ncbi:MAG: DUF4011 domain-containing protein [Planctomycetes bacterium]|nr:DUF4011 domain-containing protein [Planctomycetota bacterium]MCW8135399.1 DUF4011 domain-containing protein [Planctomycetota bacterium]
MNAAVTSAVRRLNELAARLVNITRGNKSIRLLRKTKKQCLDLTELDQLRPGTAAEVLRAVLADKRARMLTQRDDTGESEVSRTYNKLDSNLTQLSRNAAAIEAETGAMDLYVGYPFIAGNCSDPDGTYLQAPLLLYPVQISVTREARVEWHLEPRDDAEPVFNTSLRMALEQYHNTRLPDDFIEQAEAMGDDGENAKDPGAIVAWFRQRLSELGLRLAEPEAALAPLPEYRADEVPRGQQFTIRGHAVVGYFPQTDSALSADYEALIAQAQAGGLPDVLARMLDSGAHVPAGDGVPRTMDAIAESATHWILPSDASQEAAMLRARAEKCLVIHGPPGTGKSQVICNMIADALSRNERVLLCCQKRAALDVVYQRLEKEGLARHVALVHDYANDRHRLYADIEKALEGHELGDAGSLEREVETLARNIDDSTAHLRELAAELHRPRRFGMTARQLYALAPRDEQSDIDLMAAAAHFDTAQLDRFCDALARLRAQHERLGDSAEVWSGRESFARLGMGDRLKINSALDSVASAATALEQAAMGVPHPDAEAHLLADALRALRRQLETYNGRRGSLFRFFSGDWRRARDHSRAWLAAKGIADTGDEVQRYIGKLQTLEQAHSAALAAIEALAQWLKDKARDVLAGKVPDNVPALVTLVGKLKQGLGSFETFQAIDAILDPLREVERSVFRHVRKQGGDWVATVRRNLLLGWVDEAERESPALRKVTHGEADQLRERLRVELDRRRELNARALALTLHNRATVPRFEPGREVDGRHSAETPWRDLKHQATKKRRLWPIRRLVHELRWPLMEVMPCWLVSPETLSACFPLDAGLFDMVIFDEASQMAVQFGFPALCRAKRSVVAGDEQQLRPFDLFGALGLQSESDDEPEDEDTAATESESILTLAKARFPEEMLACHYRSKFEELIEFSNQGFYQGRLITAPSASGINIAPIEWRKVTGLWQGRSNKPEAQAVLELVHELLRAGEKRSIGVITFNSTQRDCIMDEKDRRCGEDPAFAALIAQAENPVSGNRDEALFVKNIENVQGDERDIIIFSIGYAPQPDGRVYNRFGTLSQEGGDNRLNVAVSRAKERIYVVSSIEPEQLDVGSAKNRGPRLLREYLAYAKAVSRRAADDRDAVLRAVNPALDVRVARTGTFESPLEQQVFEALSRSNLTLVPQVGVSGYRIDLGVVDPAEPSRYLLGIECDGATWHSAPSARERDAYRQRFLESRGWKIHRIWSRNWWRDPQAEVAAVLKAAAVASASGR